MAWTPTPPAAIAALVTTLTQGFAVNPDTADVVVRDGPDPQDAYAPDVLTVGWSGGEDDTAAEGSFASGGLAGLDTEAYNVNCAVSAADGDGDVVAARQRAWDLLTAAGRLIAADRTLGRTVNSARVAAWSLHDPPTTTGAIATIVFAVEISAFTGR